MQAVKKTAVVKPDGNVEVLAKEFAPGASVEIILLGNEIAPKRKEKGALFRKLSQIKIDGPPDWSANVDKYLYGPETDAK